MEAGELMATANIYAYDGHYDNITSTSTGWLDGDNQLYAGKDTSEYRSRIYFKLNLGDGRPITISKAQLYLRRNDGGTSTGNITAYVTNYGNSSYGQNLNVSSGTGNKYWTFNATQRNELVAKNKSNVIVYIHHASTARKRFTGYANGAYSSTHYPHLIITWDYSKSTGLVTSNYYDQAATLKITSAYSTYTHKVKWCLPDGTTAFYTQTLAAGTTTSSCTYYGTNATGGVSAETKGDFFGSGYTATFKVILETYDANGTLLGTNTYNVPLNKPQGFSTGTIEDCAYNEAATLKFNPAYASYSHKVKWYIRGSLITTTNVASTNSTSALTSSYTYFGSLNPASYFTVYSSKCPASVVLETYATDGTLQGQQSIAFNLIKEPDGEMLLVDLNPNPIVLSSSVIVGNHLLNKNSTLDIMFSDISNYVLNKLRPVGSIYISDASTNPSSLFGGTWEAYAPARTLLTTTNYSEVGQTGGSFTHTLTVNEMPSHNHNMNYYKKANQYLYTGTGDTVIGGSTSSTHTVGNTGGGKAHNNTQPYEVCYMWKRTT